MKDGSYMWDNSHTRYDATEEDPKVIEAYDIACASVGRSPTSDHTMPDHAALFKAQEADPEAQRLIKIALSGPNTNGYIVHEHLIKREVVNPFTHDITLQVFIPTSLQAQVVASAHSDLCSFHYGHIRTYAKLKERVFWHGMFIDTKQYVRKCEVCQ